MLEVRKSDVLNRIKFHKDWVEGYDLNVGPFADKYTQMTKDIGTIYEKAKIGHTKGIDMLKKEFNYHPLFKKPGDTFTGIPFRPI